MIHSYYLDILNITEVYCYNMNSDVCKRIRQLILKSDECISNLVSYKRLTSIHFINLNSLLQTLQSKAEQIDM